MQNLKRNYKSFDFFLLGLVLTLAIFGVVLIGSATHINVLGTSVEYSRQKIWIVSGLVLLVIASFVDYEFICKFYIPIYIVNLALLILVLFIGTSSGVNRWIEIGPATIQPSEFAKLFMIIFLAKFLSDKQDDINKLSVLASFTVLVMVPVYLIKSQPSLSASLVVLGISCIMLFSTGLNFKYIGEVVGIGLVAISALMIDLSLEKPMIADKILDDYMIGRITGTDLTQTNYSIQAIASGQLNGKGLYNGAVNQLNYLPESHNDFIFAVLSEEFGFIGAVVVLTIMLLIILRCLYIAYKAATLTGRLIAIGVASVFFLQTFFNVGVSTGLLPNTGVPFPLMSYGGSSMWVNMVCIGLVINVRMTYTKSFFGE